MCTRVLTSNSTVKQLKVSVRFALEVINIYHDPTENVKKNFFRIYVCV